MEKGGVLAPGHTNFLSRSNENCTQRTFFFTTFDICGKDKKTLISCKTAGLLGGGNYIDQTSSD